MRPSTAGGVTATVALPPAPPPPRHYSLRRLARYRLSHHLSSYRKQKSAAKSNDAPKAFDESDSLLSFPSTSSASTPNDRVNIPIEKLFEDAQHSMRLDLSKRESKEISSQLAKQFDLSDTLLIDLSAGNLTDLPEFVRRLTRLRTVIANNNRLSTVAMSAASLTYLDLSFNRLCELSDVLITGTPQLRILLLAGNRVETLNPTIERWAATLEELDLSSNFLGALPAELSSLRVLRVLNVSDNRLSGLPREMGELTSLSLFDASRNRLERLPSSLWHLTSNTLATVVFRVDDNPLIEPPLHVVRRGRQHIGKYLRELAIKESEANIDDVKAYTIDFCRSHGIGGSAPPKMRGHVVVTSWHVPLSVNTQSAPNAFTTNGTAAIGGTDSGYASTVDENRFSHEFAMTNGLPEERRNSTDRHSTSQRTTERRMPAIPQLDLSAVESSEAPINRARKTENQNGAAVIKSPAQFRKGTKSVDSNNNYSQPDNNYNNNSGKPNCADDRTENPKDVINITLPTTKSAFGNAASPISRVSVSRNANLLNSLHSSHGSASVLSPLVERNESSWTSAIGEKAQQISQGQNATSANITTKSSVLISTSNVPKDSKNADNSTNSKMSKTNVESSSTEDKNARRLPLKSTVPPASATLPRKKIHETTQKNIFTVLSTSNSSEDLTKLTTKPSSAISNTKPLASSNSRLARSITVKPAANSSTKITGNDAIKSAKPTLSTKTTRSTAIAAPSVGNAKASASATMSRFVASKSQPTDKPANRSAQTATAKLSRSVVAPTSTDKTAGPAPTKRVIAAPSPASARSIRAGSTAPRGEKPTAQPLSQKSCSTLQLTRKVAPATSTTNRLAANAVNANLKRNN